MTSAKIPSIKIDHVHSEVMHYGQRSPFFFFVGGMSRSGTTWVMHLLNGHTDLCCIGEAMPFGGLAAELSGALGRYNDLAGPKNTTKMLPVEGIDSLGARRVFETAVREVIRANTDKPMDKLLGIGEKTPDNLMAVNLVWNNIPDARFIYVVRDCRDVAVSGWYRFKNNVMKHWQTREEYSRAVAEAWVQRTEKAHAEAARRDPALYHELRYEDLLSAPHETLRDLFDFLKIDSSHDTVAAALAAGSFEKHSGGRKPGQVDEASQEAHYRKGVSGEWVSEFSDAEKQLTWEIAGPLLTSFGYSETA